jgi:S1-C subfamily serine protease
MLRSLDKGIYLTENCPSFRGKIRSFYLFEGMGVFSHIGIRCFLQDLRSRKVLSVPRGHGSSCIWDDAGHVVTNHHGIEGASAATIKLADGSHYKCSLVGASPAHDITVLRIGAATKARLRCP